MVQNRFLELLARKARREGRSISRRKCAQETGISLSSVQNWANNTLTRFDSLQIETFCDYLDCRLDELLILEGDESGQIKAAS